MDHIFMSTRLKNTASKVSARSIRGKALKKKRKKEDKQESNSSKDVPIRVQFQDDIVHGQRREPTESRSGYRIKRKNELPCLEYLRNAGLSSETNEVVQERESLQPTTNLSSESTYSLPRAKVVRDMTKLLEDARRGGQPRIQKIQQIYEFESFGMVPVLYDASDMKNKPNSIWFQNFGATDKQTDANSVSYAEGEEDPEEPYLALPREGTLKGLLRRARKKCSKARRALIS